MMGPTLSYEQSLEDFGVIVRLLKLQLLQGGANNSTSIRLTFNRDCNLLEAGFMFKVD
ncbi:hypothetical protein [Tautonia marina]|uniref:hypothetical protein n=1 Tax=Tautonia marina TaxID=2653855 RepID=UPI0013755D57|nr:hypothetical protein [Tautonia marina]